MTSRPIIASDQDICQMIGDKGNWRRYRLRGLFGLSIAYSV